MMATRYSCQTYGRSGFCDSGSGMPKRKTCSYCGGKFRIEKGLWGVFIHNPENQYPATDALEVRKTERGANIVAHSNGWVARWIPEADVSNLPFHLLPRDLQEAPR